MPTRKPKQKRGPAGSRGKTPRARAVPSKRKKRAPKKQLARTGSPARATKKVHAKRAGTKDAQGTPIPPLTLPAHYSFGNNFHTLDLRVTRLFVIDGRWRASLIGEVFNVYNKANLSGYSGDLTNSATFGQPTSRAAQIFGSGGPRAFQLAARMNF